MDNESVTQWQASGLKEHNASYSHPGCMATVRRRAIRVAWTQCMVSGRVWKSFDIPYSLLAIHYSPGFLQRSVEGGEVAVEFLLDVGEAERGIAAGTLVGGGRHGI